MGNTPTKDKQQDIYASYIEQQQNLISRQQNQINELYKFNLQAQQEIPPNMFFQNDINQQSYRQSGQPRSEPRAEQPRQLPPAPKQKLDPYKTLNLDKIHDEKTLKKAYLKAAMKAHPDRGGTPDMFQLVSIAYAVLSKKLKESSNSHSHNDLREMSNDYTKQQSGETRVGVNMTDNFDVNVFNKIYEENKIPESFDEGYGSWMNKTNSMDTSQSKLFQSGFNKDLFNHTFNKFKQEQGGDSQLTKYREPGSRISSSNQDSLMTLGQGKVANFGGETANLSFSDYKQAFTDGSTLIDTSSVDISNRPNSINSIKTDRGSISYTMDSAHIQALSLQKLEEEKAEQDRIQRLQVYDQRNGEVYDKIHSRLLR